jgi:hypothetical protein
MAKRKRTTRQTTMHKTDIWNKRSGNTNCIKYYGRIQNFGRVSSCCSTSDTRRVNLATNHLIRQEGGKDREVFATSGTYSWSFVPHISNNSQTGHDGDRKSFEMMTSTSSIGIIGSIESFLATSLSRKSW